MGSLRPSMRSKASGHVGHHHVPNGHAMAASTGNSHALRDELTVFESANFDADAYVQGKCQSMSEKGIRRLCADLQELKKDSAEEMRKSVYANYSAFIRTSREISDLEGELESMRNLLNTQAGIVRKLADVRLPAMIIENGSTDPFENGYIDDDDDETSGLDQDAETLPEHIDVCIEERKIEQALEALEKGEELVASMKLRESQDTKFTNLENALAERRIRLAELLTRFSKQQSVKGAKLRSIILALNKLGDGPQAHTLLLNAYHERLRHSIQSLRPNGTSFGGDYTATLSQQVFSHIAQAARDSLKVFGDQPAYASELTLWARKEVEAFAMLVKKYVLSASAASGGLRGAAECVQIALGHCLLLENHGLVLCPVLTKLVKPSVEDALSANLRRIEDSVSVLAAADDWVLQQPSASGMHLPSHLRLSTSAYRLISMVQEFLDDVMPLSSMNLISSTLDGVAILFESYISLLMRAMPCPGDEEEMEVMDNLNIRVAETDLEKLALLANVANLADELLPRAVTKLLPLTDDNRVKLRTEQREFRRRTQRAAEKLRDRFCKAEVLELIYTEEGAQLSASLYLDMDIEPDEPSPIFQAIFQRFRQLASTCAEVMPGKDRFSTTLLIRLVEYVVFFLSSDTEFWENIEMNVEPKGLQQLVLDMYFALQMAGQMNHHSIRHLNQMVGDNIDRAVSVSGLDPSSLPETDWFLAAAQNAIDKYSADWVKEPLSPAASMSSSIRSHGSP